MAREANALEQVETGYKHVKCGPGQRCHAHGLLIKGSVSKCNRSKALLVIISQQEVDETGFEATKSEAKNAQ